MRAKKLDFVCNDNKIATAFKKLQSKTSKQEEDKIQQMGA